MPRFKYRAYSPSGALEEKEVAAETAAHLHRGLTEKGYRALSVQPVGGFQNWLYQSMPTFFGGVNPEELILFTRQLSTFLKVGVPLTDGIRLLQDESGSIGFRAALDKIVEDLDSGDSLSQALGKHPRVFDRLFVDMVRAAEVGGNLEDVLLQIAAYQQRAQSALKRLQTAMYYPAVVFSLAVVIVVILSVVILPTFISLFNEFGSQLPPTTKALVAIGTFIRDHILYIGIGLAVIVVAAVVWFSTEQGKYSWSWFLTKAPMLGSIVTYTIVERFARTLATMLRAGIPIGQTFDIVIAATGNRRYMRGLAPVKDRMVMGEGFSEPLQDTGLFQPMMVRMIRVGEETGTLESSLDQLADFLADETDYKIKNMIALIEPAMIIFIGVVVLFVAVSVIQPLYGLLHAIH
jgi:type IV pilus assembly protein PilC